MSIPSSCVSWIKQQMLWQMILQRTSLTIATSVLPYDLDEVGFWATAGVFGQNGVVGQSRAQRRPMAPDRIGGIDVVVAGNQAYACGRVDRRALSGRNRPES